MYFSRYRIEPIPLSEPKVKRAVPVFNALELWPANSQIIHSLYLISCRGRLRPETARDKKMVHRRCLPIVLQWSLLFLHLLTIAPPIVHYIEDSDLPSCWIPCAFNYSGVESVPGTGCSLYQVCFMGEVRNRVACGEGLLYNVNTKYCDYTWNVNCDLEPTCPPTLSPSESPTNSPSGEFFW